MRETLPPRIRDPCQYLVDAAGDLVDEHGHEALGSDDVVAGAYAGRDARNEADELLGLLGADADVPGAEEGRRWLGWPVRGSVAGSPVNEGRPDPVWAGGEQGSRTADRRRREGARACGCGREGGGGGGVVRESRRGRGGRETK
jgi:hypothetical protein